MPDLTNYGGDAPLPSHIQNLFGLLEDDGFAVGVTPQQRPGKAVRTLHVLWRGVQVGYTKQDMWSENGRKVLLGYKFAPGTDSAKDPCPVDFDLAAFSRHHGCEPLNFFVREDEGGEKAYLRICSIEAALKVLRASRRKVDQQLFGDRETSQHELEEDLKQTRGRQDISETTKKRLVDARLGQGQFRSELEEVFNSGCAVTGVRLRDVLRASHILPWREANDEARLDVNNGLLLAANLDALFDRFLITFDRAGAIQISPAISKSERELLGPLKGLVAAPSEQQWKYLALHNEEYDAKVSRHKKSAAAG